eukprot:3772293-Amphidinium_carterae.1
MQVDAKEKRSGTKCWFCSTDTAKKVSVDRCWKDLWWFHFLRWGSAPESVISLPHLQELALFLDNSNYAFNSPDALPSAEAHLTLGLPNGTRPSIHTH